MVCKVLSQLLKDFLKTKRNKSWNDVIYSIIIFSMALLPRIISLNWGLNIDEYGRIIEGVQYIDNWLYGFFRPENWMGEYHPPMVKYLMGISVKLLTPYGVNILVAARVPIAILGALTSVIAYYLGKDFFNEKTGILAAFILMLDPPFLAASRVCWYDVPMTFFASLSIFYFYRGIKITNKRALLYLAISGVFCGLAISSKYFGVFTLLVAFLWIIFMRITSKQEAFTLTYMQVTGLILFLAICLVTFIISWPLLWLPIKYFTMVSIEPLQRMMHEGHTHFFMGQTYNFTPVYYYLVLLVGVTTPFELLGFIVGGIFVVSGVVRHALAKEKLLFVIWFIVVLCGISIISYKCTRYLAMLSLPFAILSSVGLLFTARAMSKFPIQYRHLSFGIKIAPIMLLILHMVGVILVHPYYGLYFSPLVGKPNDVMKIYQVGSDEGLREASFYLLQNCRPSSKIAVFGHVDVVKFYAPSLTVESVNKMSYDTFMRGHYTYIIFQLDFIQRYHDHQLWEAFKDQEPIYVVVINEFPMVRIYMVPY